MSLKRIYFDESGNTGAALCDVDQPVFSLASVDISDLEANEILHSIGANKAPVELKFSQLKRRENGKLGILNLIKKFGLNSNKVKICVLHKPFMVIAKAVDTIVEPLARRDGVDIYKQGFNIAFSNMFYMGLDSFCKNEARRRFIEAFEKMVRSQDKVARVLFFEIVRNIFINCQFEEFKSMLAPFLSAEPIIDEILYGTKPYSLDPAIPALVNHLVSWGHNYDEFEVVHDRSKLIANNISLFDALFQRKGISQSIGYDRRQFDLPLKARRIIFGDSQAHPQLQIADIVAGAASLLAVSRATGIDNGFADDLVEAGIEKFLICSLWPNEQVTPAALGTSEDVGSNPQDSMESWLRR